MPEQWNSKSAEKTIDELNKFLEPRSEIDIELHIKQVEKNGQVLEMLGSDHNP